MGRAAVSLLARDLTCFEILGWLDVALPDRFERLHGSAEAELDQIQLVSLPILLGDARHQAEWDLCLFGFGMFGKLPISNQGLVPEALLSPGFDLGVYGVRGSEDVASVGVASERPEAGIDPAKPKAGLGHVARLAGGCRGGGSHREAGEEREGRPEVAERGSVHDSLQ